MDHPGSLNRAEYYLNSELNGQVNVALQHIIWKFFYIITELSEVGKIIKCICYF